MRNFMFVTYIIFIFLYPKLAYATADGPDYFQVKNNHSVYIYENANGNSAILNTILPRSDYLKNMGCTSMPSLNAWEKMTDDEKIMAQENIWCQISYIGITGWVKNTDLAEGSSLSALPTFSCNKEDLHEIEALICQDDDLKILDYEMDNIYRQALSVAQNLRNHNTETVKELEATQHKWIKDRNECWKDIDNKRTCTRKQYLERITHLQTQWNFVEPNIRATYICNDNLQHKVVTHFYNHTAIASVKIEYGDLTAVLTQTIAASGAKYEGILNKLFWVKGNEALFTWSPIDADNHCITGD